jgi:hypothetical protein
VCPKDARTPRALVPLRSTAQQAASSLAMKSSDFMPAIDKNHKAEGGTPSAYYGRKIDEKSFCLLQVLRYPTVVKNHRKEVLQKY